MARNKNSTALFDVIHAAKKPPKASPSASIPTPRWWGKDRKIDKKVPQPTPNVSTETVGKQKSWLSAAKKSVVVPSAAPIAAIAESGREPESVETPATEGYQTAEPVAEPNTERVAGLTAVEPTVALTAVIKPRNRFIDRFVNRPSTNSEVLADPTQPISAISKAPVPTPALEHSVDWTDSEFVQVTPAPKRVAIAEEPVFKVDPGRKEFLFRLSYGGIIAIGFIFLLALGIAFIAGKRTAIETADADSQPGSHGASGTGLMAAVGPAKPDRVSTSGGLTSGGLTSGGIATSGIASSGNVLNIDPHHSRPAIVISNPSAPTIPTTPPLPMKRAVRLA